MTGLTDAISVTASENNNDFCALLSTGGVDCWGNDTLGQLGNGTTGGPYDTPQAVTGITDAISVTTDTNGDLDYCALLSSGAVDCWGANPYGEVGNGTVGGPDYDSSYDTPQTVTGITDAASFVTAGNYDGYCVVLLTGSVDCWGRNLYGGIGDGTAGRTDGASGYDTPQAVTGLTEAVSLTGSVALGYCAFSRLARWTAGATTQTAS